METHSGLKRQELRRKGRKSRGEERVGGKRGSSLNSRKKKKKKIMLSEK